MSAFYTCDYGVRFAFVTMYFATSICLIYLSIRSIADNRRKTVVFQNTVLTLAAAALTTALAQCHFYSFRTSQWRVRIPLWILALILAAMIIYIAMALISNIRMRKSTVTWTTVREAMDNIPVAVSYFDSDGMPRLSNRMMLRIGILLSGSDFQSITELRNAVKLSSADSPDDGSKVSSVPGLVRLPDGRTFSYTEYPLTTDDGTEYTGAFLFDVTDLQNKKAELLRQTEDLRKISGQLKYLNDNAYKLAREEEILAFQTRLHDAMGAGLTAVHRILEQNYPEDDYSEAINIWRKSSDMIDAVNESGKGQDSLADFEHDAEALGVRFSLDGEMPQGREAADVILTALHTGLTNCIKHARATEMHAEIRNEKGDIVLSVTNNGASPEGEVVPGGGLTNLKDQAVRLGGRVEIITQPEFVLKLIIPEETGRNIFEGDIGYD